MRLPSLTLGILLLARSAWAFDCSNVTLPSSAVICSDLELMRVADERQAAINEARARLCGAANRVRGRIASSAMFPEAEALPHLICSRPMVIGGVMDEADQHGSARRVGDGDSGSLCTRGSARARPHSGRVRGGDRLSPQAC